MTKLGNTRHLSALLLIAAMTLLPQTAPAQMRGGLPNQSEMIYVQAPAWSSMAANANQPIVSPAQIPDSQLGQVMHFWPRFVSYTMETDGITPFVQNDLSLGVQYNYSFTFDLSARTANGKPLAVPDGWYQLQLVVIRKSKKDVVGNEKENAWDRYVTSTSTFLQVHGGSIEQKISMRFPELSETASKHHLFVELIPLREDCELEGNNGKVKYPCLKLDSKGKPDPMTSELLPRSDVKTYLVEMPFVPYMAIPGKRRSAEDVSEQELPFTDSSLTQYANRARAYKSRQRQKNLKVQTPAQYAADQNLPFRSINDGIYKNAQSSIEQLFSAQTIGNLKAGANLAPLYRVLCEDLAGLNQERQNLIRLNRSLSGMMRNALRAQLNRCANEPQDYIRITRVTHLGKPILSGVKRIFQKPLTYTIMSNYMSNRSSSIDSISGVTYGMKVPQLPFISKFLEQAGMTIGGSHTVNYASSRSRAETGIASMSDSLDFNYHAMRIPVAGSQTCIEVRAVKSLPSTIYDNSTGASNGIYLCAEPSEEKILVNEVYAHAYERCRETSSTDCDGVAQSVNVTMRGDREMSQFFYQVRRGVTPDHNNLVVPFGDMEGAARYFANTPLTGQMQVINPVEFPQDPVPSYWQRISGTYRENFKD